MIAFGDKNLFAENETSSPKSGRRKKILFGFFAVLLWVREEDKKKLVGGCGVRAID
jgi:hypothetical protein